MSTIKQPAVSIVIPCYNYGHFLSETLESVLDQTWQQWECIIVNDGSTDNTEQVVEHFQIKDPRFKYVSQQNLGVSAARNAGINACQGSYIQLLDADDKLENKKLEKQLAYLEQHQAVDIVYGEVCYFQENNVNLNVDISKRRAFSQISGVGNEILPFLIRRNLMVINAPLVKISVFKEVGPFNSTLIGNEDWEYWIRCCLAGRRFSFMAGEKTCALVRAHSISATQNILPMLSTGLVVREHLQTLRLPAALYKENNYRIGLQLVKLAKCEISGGDWSLGFKHASQAVWRLRGDVRIIVISIFLITPLSVATQIVLVSGRVLNFLLRVIKY